MLVLFGSLGTIAPVLVTLSLATILIGLAARRNALSEVFPTASWALFMQLPFILVSSGFEPSVARMHGISVVVVAVAFLVSDGLGLLRSGSAKGVVVSRLEPPLTWLLAAFVIYLPIYHAIQAGSLPVLDRFVSGASAIETAENRESFGKLLDVSLLYTYGFNWVLSVFGPLLTTLLLIRRNWIPAVIVVVWLCAYAVLSTAKQPLLMYLLLSAFGASVIMPKPAIDVIRVMMLALLVCFSGLGIYRTWEIVETHNSVGITSKAYQEFSARPTSQDPLKGFTVGDADRLRDSSAEPTSLRIMRYLVYRTFLTPVEVAHHWFAYFPTVQGEWRALGEIAGQREEGISHAANRVGKWAYYERFPDNYLNSVSAYASVDADAYAFGGLWGVLITALALGGLRSATAISGTDRLTAAIGRIIVAQLGLFIVGASVQAILIPQGMALLIGLLFLARLLGQPKPAVSRR